MSDQIMQKLDEMQALTCSSPVPLGVSIARHTDRLLAETRREMYRAVNALKAVLELHQPVPYAQGPDYCDECEHTAPCQTMQAIEEALGVEV